MNTNTQAREALAVIRQAATALPTGKRNQVLNRCNRIDLILRRNTRVPEAGLARKAASTAEADTRTAAEQSEQVAEQYNTAQRIVAALLAGRTLSQRDSKEFKTTAFHSRIADARRIISRQYPQHILCSRYTDKEETIAGRPFKLYWLEIL